MAKGALIDLRQVFSLTDFLRHHRRHIDRLTESGKPSVLTVNGKPALIIQDTESYQVLLDRLASLEASQTGA
ncbi:MAG: hypothetical protein KF784_05700 [Fimbriimonadaceae bacterium]|nr:hypothetical protein [Fimbriimonadaceae bacterium]